MAEEFLNTLVPENHVTLAPFLQRVECFTDDQYQVIGDVLTWLRQDYYEQVASLSLEGDHSFLGAEVSPPSYWENREAWFNYHGDNVKDDPDFRDDPEGWCNKYC